MRRWLLLEHPWQLPLLYFSLRLKHYTLMSTKSMPRSFNRSYMDTSTSMEREEKSGLTDDTFAWTQEQFDALIESDLDNKGKGGTTYEDIINKHGKPDSEFDFTLGGYNTKKGDS